MIITVNETRSLNSPLGTVLDLSGGARGAKQRIEAPLNPSCFLMKYLFQTQEKDKRHKT